MNSVLERKRINKNKLLRKLKRRIKSNRVERVIEIIIHKHLVDKSIKRRSFRN
jgi:hypothetical protein